MKGRDALRGLLQRYGTDSVKRRIWNQEYGQGRWACLDEMPADCLYPFVEQYAKGGDILDLGCGPGTVGNELNPVCYRRYTGVDISDSAVEKAKSRTAETGRAAKNEFFRADILTYLPKQHYEVILFGDSLYYFSPRRAAKILDRYSPFLRPSGAFILRSWLVKPSHQEIVCKIESAFHILERASYCDFQLVVIVFQPAANRREPRGSA